MSNKKEIELKFCISSGEVRAQLQACPLWAAGEWNPKEMYAVYYDTPEGRLSDAGVSLRFRLENGAGVVNAKLRTVPDAAAGGAFSREEFETFADSIDAGVKLLAAEPALTGLLSGVTLRETVRLAYHRLEKEFDYRDARICVALDEGWLGAAENRFSELELELVSGSPAVFPSLAEYLSGAFGLQPSLGGKLTRAKRYMDVHRLGF